MHASSYKKRKAYRVALPSVCAERSSAGVVLAIVGARLQIHKVRVRVGLVPRKKDETRMKNSCPCTIWIL